VEQVENRVSGTEDKVEKLDQTVIRSQKKCYNEWENPRHLGHHEKTKTTNHGYRRRRREMNQSHRQPIL
jgi:hypothetical protein